MLYINAIAILNIYKIVSYTLYRPYKRCSDRLRKLLKKTRFWKTFQNIQRRHALLALLLLYQKEVTRQKKRSLPLRHRFYLHFPSISSTMTGEPFSFSSHPPTYPDANSYKKEENMKEKRRDGRKGKNQSLALGYTSRLNAFFVDLPVFEARQILIPLLNTCTRNRKSN